MADSVRIPTNTVSLIILNLTFHTPLDDAGEPVITHLFLNDIYRQAAEGSQKGMLVYSDRQNVSSDLIGVPAAAVIEGHESHTRTGFINLPPDTLASLGLPADAEVQIPVTHAKLFGWYDNEYGSYVNCLGKLTTYLAGNMG
jgi:glyceraldehyde 3-phosphate dehydrogenase